MNLIIIARHYSKQLLRNRLFQVYFLLSFVGIIYIQIYNQSDLPQYSVSGLASLSSFIPYMNAYLFTLFQVIPVLFLTNALLSRGRKIDSMDAIFYRPESNAEYVWGMSLAFIFIFFITGCISQVFAALIHLFASEAPFDFSIYLFYLFTLILPAIIFPLGFSLIIISRIRNRAISLIVLLGSMFILNFYINDFQQGVLDPLGLSLPNTFSGITGHPDLIRYLLQRGCWLFLGLGFIQCTVLNFSRIPNNPGRVKPLLWTLACLFIGVSCGSIFFFSHRTDIALRGECIATYEKYAIARHGNLVQEEINYRQQGSKMIAGATMIIRNETTEELEKVILYLNPSLKVTSIESGGEKIAYEREYQVILIEKNLSPGQDVEILVRYEGKINENVCYPDVPDKIFLNTRDRSYMTCRYGKRYAFLDRAYTLLIPEVLWYPVTVPPVNLRTPYNSLKNFTRYTLKVIQPGDRTVISQGERRSVGDTLVFQNKYPLLGISLCMGNYERRTISIDSMKYELNIFKEHTSLLENMKWLNNESALQEFLSDLNENVKMKVGRDYPYDHFVLTEMPIAFTSYFRNRQGGSGYVQPEIVFLPERGIGIWSDFKYMTTSSLNKALQNVFVNTEVVNHLFSLNRFLGLRPRNIASFMPRVERKGNPYTITPMFYNYTISVASNDYPIMNQVLGVISRSTKSKKRVYEPTERKLESRATRYLAQNSLKDALEDKRLGVEELNEILRLKSGDLVSRLKARGIPSDSLISFVNLFLKNHEFQLVDFSKFSQLFAERFGFDWKDILPSWFTQDRLPRFLIKDFSAKVIKEITEEMGYPVTRIEFSVFNDSPEDGIITIEVLEESSSGVKVELSVVGGSEPVERLSAEYSYVIPAGKGQKIAFIQHKCPRYITLNMNLSENIPNCITKSSVDGIAGVSMSQFVQEIDRNYFLEEPGEIVVDNEDSTFFIFQSSSRLKVQSFFNKQQPSEDKYGNLTSMMNASASWKFYVDESTFGRVIQSAVLRKAGDGTSSVEWHTSIDKEGEYEVYVYLPNTSFSFYKGFLISVRDITELLSDTQTYMVSAGNGDKKVIINTYRQEGWVSLGRFYYKPGNYKVSLSDRGQPEQLIVGDAVKWKYCEE